MILKPNEYFQHNKIEWEVVSAATCKLIERDFPQQEMHFTDQWLVQEGYMSATEAVENVPPMFDKIVEYDGQKFKLISYCRCYGTWLGRWPD